MLAAFIVIFRQLPYTKKYAAECLTDVWNVFTFVARIIIGLFFERYRCND